MIRKILILGLLAIGMSMPVHAEKLVILQTNDTHSQIDPNADDGLGGIARRKVLIDSVRAAEKNVILVDAGDIVQGSLFFNIYRGELEEKLMNALGYEIRILGNHEFDNGLEALAKNLENANAELLTINYDFDGTPVEGLFKPYTIREVDGKRIAFMGVNLQPKGMISPRNFEGMGYNDALEAANAMAWYLKHIEKADLVVAITHVGYDSPTLPNDLTLVKESKYIDAIIGGHSHTYLRPEAPDSKPWMVENAEGREIVVTQDGKSGRYLGQLTFDLDDLTKAPEYKTIRIDERLDAQVDPAIEEIISPYRAEVDALYRKKVGKVGRTMERDDQGLINFVADFTLNRGRQLADSVDFAIINKGGIRCTLNKGDLTEGKVIEMLPFFNVIQVADIYGRDLAPAFNQMAKVGGNGISENVEATYDPNLKVATSVMIDGKPLDPNRKYRVATIDYLWEGGDYMSSLANHTDVATSDKYVYEDFLDYLRNTVKGKKINPKDNKRMYAKPLSTLNTIN